MNEFESSKKISVFGAIAIGLLILALAPVGFIARLTARTA